MGYISKEKHILLMQVEIVRKLIERWNITEEEYVNLDRKYKITEYIGIHYEIYHLMGNECIFEEVEEYLEREKRR